MKIKDLLKLIKYKDVIIRVNIKDDYFQYHMKDIDLLSNSIKNMEIEEIVPLEKRIEIYV